jgi:glucose-1-phosphate thymidylyltransferase
MKALVLAGGTGLRLRPFSHSRPKQLVPVANKPILHYGLESIAVAGITDVGMIVNARSDAIRESAGDGSAFNIKLTYISQEAPLGLAHCVLLARDFLGDDDFVMYLADNVVPGGISAVVADFQRERPDALLAVGAVADPRQYGVAEVDAAGRVLSVIEKAPTPRSRLAITGVYVFSDSVHRAVASIEPSDRGELEITHAIQWLVERGADVRAHVLAGAWKDTGKVGDLLDCNRLVLGTLAPDVRGKCDQETEIVGPVVLAEGAELIRSRVIGPTVIGAGSVVSDCYVGPYTSIGDDCLVEGSGIEYSVVLNGASVRSLPYLRDSVIGERARVCAASSPGNAARLVIGDDCEVAVRSCGSS